MSSPNFPLLLAVIIVAAFGLLGARSEGIVECSRRDAPQYRTEGGWSCRK